ncbi:hypothetical protein PATSB16_07120 [Pandoraea thiooxydans]|nr:hypothetical protein PATSB16_07120 [Pandoraea thiooxydans]
MSVMIYWNSPERQASSKQNQSLFTNDAGVMIRDIYRISCRPKHVSRNGFVT